MEPIWPIPLSRTLLSKPISKVIGEVVSLKMQIQTSGVRASKACRTLSSKEDIEMSKVTRAPRMRSNRIRPLTNCRKESGNRSPSKVLLIQPSPLGESSNCSTACNRGQEKSSGATRSTSDFEGHLLGVESDWLH